MSFTWTEAPRDSGKAVQNALKTGEVFSYFKQSTEIYRCLPGTLNLTNRELEEFPVEVNVLHHARLLRADSRFFQCFAPPSETNAAGPATVPFPSGSELSNVLSCSC